MWTYDTAFLEENVGLSFWQIERRLGANCVFAQLMRRLLGGGGDEKVCVKTNGYLFLCMK